MDSIRTAQSGIIIALKPNNDYFATLTYLTVVRLQMRPDTFSMDSSSTLNLLKYLDKYATIIRDFNI